MPTDREPATAACAFGDPTCPCQDGDVCHYVDDPLSETLAMTPPTTAATEPERVRAVLRMLLDSGDITQTGARMVEKVLADEGYCTCYGQERMADCGLSWHREEARSHAR